MNFNRFARIVSVTRAPLIAAIMVGILLSGCSGFQVLRNPRAPGMAYLAPANAPASLFVLSTREDAPTEIFAPAFGIAGFAVTSDGDRIAATVLRQDQTTEIWILDRDGKNTHRIDGCESGICSGAAWAPDGNLLAYERREANGSGELGPARTWFYDVSSDSSAPVFENELIPSYGPQFSADGSQLAFFEADIQAIRILTLETAAQKLVPSALGEVGSFSPDGTLMAFTDIRQVGRQFYPEIRIASLDEDNDVRQLDPDNAQEDRSPQWSPDGAEIVFIRRLLDRSEGLASQLMLYDLAAESIRPLSSDPSMNTIQFQWSPDGEALLVQRFNLDQVEAAPQIWEYTLGTGDFQLVVENAFNARWLP